MASAQLSRNEVLNILVRVTLISVGTYYSLKWMMNMIDPTNKSKKRARSVAEQLLKRLEKSNNHIKVNPNSLNEHELMIASNLVIPEDISVSWSDIAGLDNVVQELKESIVYPIKHRDLFKNAPLYQAPKGVLLHGPPGCGKTLIAKATAKEAGMRFLNLDVAMLTDKWYGESQKLASAVFSLAAKIQPCIIFIDEIDSFLRSRNSSDHEATAMMKTQFMMLWDGLSTVKDNTVIVMGATNRPQDLDKAILRRMPAQFHIAFPNVEQRIKILRLVLEHEHTADDVDFNHLAKLTNGFSGSDLRELCRNASVYRVRELMNSNQKALDAAAGEGSSTQGGETSTPLPPIKMQDLIDSYGKMKESKMHTGMLFSTDRIDLD